MKSNRFLNACKCEEYCDAKVRICAFESGSSLDGMPIRVMDLINSSHVCECAGIDEGRSSSFLVATEEYYNSKTAVALVENFE